MLSNVKIRSKFIIFSIIPLLGLLFLASFELYKINQLLMKSRMDTTKNLVESAHSIVNHYYNLSQSGELSESAAKAQAMSAVKDLRYNETEYFWINDMHPRMVMHPYKPQLDGKDLSAAKDPAGTFLFNEMVETVKNAKAGFVYYMWPKAGDESEKPYPYSFSAVAMI